MARTGKGKSDKTRSPTGTRARTRPAATETRPEQAGPADGTAGPSPGPEGSAPPAMGDALTTSTFSASTGADPVTVTAGTNEPASEAFRAAADQSQERLEKQAEVKQPKEPVMDRVCRRLAADIDAAHVGYASRDPEAHLSGEMAKFNGKLISAMAAEGVPCAHQGDTLQFLLEQLAEGIRGAF